MKKLDHDETIADYCQVCQERGQGKFFLNQDGGYIPLKLLSRGQLKFSVKPWITPGIKKSIQIKNRYHRKFLKTKSIYFQNRFKLY